MTEVIEKLVDLVEVKRTENNYEYAEIEREEIRQYIENCWNFLDADVKAKYTKDLVENKPTSKIHEFARSISRSLSGAKKFGIQAALDNFHDIELATHSSKTPLFLEKEFSDALIEYNPAMKEKARPYAGNIQTQLATFLWDETNKAALFSVTANLIAGVSTTKSGHTRSVDHSMTNEAGQIPNENLVRAIALYARENLTELSDLAPKIQRFIGGVLKDAYKVLPANSSKEEISAAFNKINVGQQVELKAEREAGGIMNRLANLFRSRSNSDTSSTRSGSVDTSRSSSTASNEH